MIPTRNLCRAIRLIQVRPTRLGHAREHHPGEPSTREVAHCHGRRPSVPDHTPTIVAVEAILGLGHDRTAHPEAPSAKSRREMVLTRKVHRHATLVETRVIRGRAVQHATTAKLEHVPTVAVDAVSPVHHAIVRDPAHTHRRVRVVLHRGKPPREVEHAARILGAPHRPPRE